MNHYFTNNDNIKSERKIIKYSYGSSCFTFLSDNGVFSKNKIDYGSSLLVNTYLNNKKNINNFLDVGCGYGFISIVLSKILNVNGTGIDINKRALKLASENAKLNNVSVSFKESYIYNDITTTFDLIITNPPIRAGKKTVLEILKGGLNYLNPEGELWAVIRKDQGAISIINELKIIAKPEVVLKSKGFWIFFLKKN